MRNQGSNLCGTQYRNGKRCDRPVIDKERCFWHSNIEKNDENTHRYFPEYSNVRELIENERPYLERAHLNKTNLRDADLHGLTLAEAYFVEADLTGCNLRKADLQSANCTNTILIGAEFSEAVLDKAGFVRAKLQRTKFTGARRINTSFDDCDLSEADLSGVIFKSTKLIFVNLYKAKLTGAQFTDRRAQLRYCNLDDPDPLNFFKSVVVRRVTLPDRR